MWRKRQLASRTLVVLLALVTSSSAAPIMITELVTAAKQDCPLQIVGFKLPDKSGGGPAVLLHNTTAKEIIWFDFSILYGDPREADGTDPKMNGVMTGQRADTMDQRRTSVAPNGDAEYVFKYISPTNLATYALPMGSACMHVAVIVETVRFSDGTVWKANATNYWSANMANDGPLWKDSIRPESGKSCDNSPEVKETLKGIKQVVTGTDPGTPLNQSSSKAVQFYSAACPVREIKGELTAVCDW